MIAGVVLAGGQSTRMGKDKSALAFGANTFLEQALQVLADVGTDIQLISGGKNENAILDPYNAGPVGGILATLATIKSKSATGILVIPVDMPGISITWIQTLVDHGVTHSCSCHYEHQPLPMFLTVTTELSDVCSHVINEGRGSLRELACRIGATTIPTAFNGDEININTPDDYQAMTSVNEV